MAEMPMLGLQLALLWPTCGSSNLLHWRVALKKEKAALYSGGDSRERKQLEGGFHFSIQCLCTLVQYIVAWREEKAPM